MSSVQTSQLEQIQFVNIVSVSQLRLKKNFEIIAKTLETALHRLDHIDTRINYNEKVMLHNQTTVLNRISDTDKALAQVQKKLGMQEEKQSEIKNCFDEFAGQVKLVQATVAQKQAETSALQLRLQEGERLAEQRLAKLTKTVEEEHPKLNIQLRMSIDRLIEEKFAYFRSALEGDVMTPRELVKKDSNQSRARQSHISMSGNSKDQKQRRLEEDLTLIEQSQADLSQQRNGPIHHKTSIQSNSNNVNSNSHSIWINRYSKNQSAQIHQLQNQIRTIKEQLSKLQSLNEKNGITEMVGLKGLLERIQKEQRQHKLSIEELRQRKGTETLFEKLKLLSNECFELEQKIGCIEDKVATIEKKQEHQNKNLNQLGGLVRECNFPRIEALLAERNTEQQTIIKDVRRDLEQRSTSKELSQLERRLLDKCKEIEEQVSSKSAKSDVKKALQYLQSKMKEIVLMILKDEQAEKDALVTKQNLKCISCDRETGEGGTGSEPRTWNMMPQRGLNIQKMGKYGMSKFGSVFKENKEMRRVETSQALMRTRKNTLNSP